MFKFDRFLCAFLVISLIAVSGCGKNEESSSVKSQSEIDATSVSAVQSETDSSSQVEKNQVGKYLKNIAKKLEKGEYTMRCTVSSSAYKGETKILRTVSGEDVYQLQSENAGSYGMVSVDGKTYDFDNATGMYQMTDAKPPKSMVEEVINLNLPMVEDLEDVPVDGIVMEQYTFTGDTYITNIVFYFDKESGDLQKYVLKYTIEGQDNVTETRVIDSLVYEADKSVLNLGFLDYMSDFGEMTEDERLSFCTRIAGIFGVTSDDMARMGIKENDYRKIDFNTFLNLIYSV